jgi:hypothetical protein
MITSERWGKVRVDIPSRYISLKADCDRIEASTLDSEVGALMIVLWSADSRDDSYLVVYETRQVQN